MSAKRKLGKRAMSPRAKRNKAIPQQNQSIDLFKLKNQNLNMAVELKRYKVRLTDANRETELANKQAELQESKFICLAKTWQQLDTDLHAILTSCGDVKGNNSADPPSNGTTDVSLFQALFQPTSHQFKRVGSDGDDEDDEDAEIPELGEALRPKCEFTKGLVQTLSRCMKAEPSAELKTEMLKQRDEASKASHYRAEAFCLRRQISTLEGKIDAKSSEYDSVFRQLEQAKEEASQKQKDFERVRAEAASRPASATAEPSAKQLKQLKQLRTENQELQSQLALQKRDPSVKYEETAGFQSLKANYFDKELELARQQNESRAQELKQENARLRKKIAEMDGILARNREQMRYRDSQKHSTESARAKQHFQTQQNFARKQEECATLQEQLKLLRYQIKADQGLRTLLEGARNELKRKTKQTKLDFMRKHERMVKKCSAFDHDRTILKEKLKRESELARHWQDQVHRKSSKSRAAAATEKAELIKYKSRLKLADESLKSAWRKQADAQKRWDALNTMAMEVKSNSEGLYTEIDETGKAYCALQEQQAEMQQQLTEKNEKLSAIRAQKEKFRQYNQGMLRKQQVMEQRLEAATANVQQFKAQIANYKQDLHTRSRAIQAENAKILQMQNALDKEKTAYSMLKANKQFEADMRWIHMSGKEEKLHKQMQEHRESIEDLRTRLLNSQKKAQKFKKKGAQTEGLLQQLKNKMKCEVCDDKYKTVMLLGCYHMFCEGCINERIESRRRKCPKCKKSFSVSDVKKIPGLL